MSMHRRSWFSRAAGALGFGAVLAWAGLGAGSAVAQSNTLRIVPHANITILDPVWTTAYVTRNHGYMIYDTLFGTGADGLVKPQMVDKWNVSKDQLLWTFTLRDGLEFHDGKPVTSEDVVASIRRWASRDSFGSTLARAVDSYGTPDAKTFTIKLKTPYGVMLEALGKPSSNVPFIMPARIAATPGTEQIRGAHRFGPLQVCAFRVQAGRARGLPQEREVPVAQGSSQWHGRW
jgi:peptide/nickel transport system substrate-binding protein